jgi:hypothetical protein
MISKEKLLETIKEMPEHFSIDELIDKIILINKIEIGLEQSEKNEVKSAEDARQQLQKWLK